MLKRRLINYRCLNGGKGREEPSSSWRTHSQDGFGIGGGETQGTGSAKKREGMGNPPQK